MSSNKRILITTGGTGGHTYPAQALAEQLTQALPFADILFVGGGLSTNRYFDRASFSFKEVPCGPLISKNPFKLLKGGVSLVKGVKQSLSIIKDFKPDLVVGFGSYYTVPILVAAKLSKVPFILHEANSIPGKANKWFAPFAASVGVHFPFTADLLKGQIVEVGLPLRKSYFSSTSNPGSCLNYFHLAEQKLTLLIFGGSQGASAINELITEALPFLQALPVQFIHLVGAHEEQEKFKHLYEAFNFCACVKDFEKNMHLAWRAANLFIGRSGASTVAEALETEVPGILIPYPYAADNHQDKNADFFADVVGGGVKYKQQDLTGRKLADIIKNFILENKLNAMQLAIKSYKTRPRLDLCQLVLKQLK